MPTARPRLTITETDDIARMIDAAADRWPEDRDHRARLLKRLAAHGAAAVRSERATDRTAWEALVRDVAGSAGPDAYPPGYLDRLRDDWPE